MSHYKSNVRDLEFNLFEVLRRQEVLGKGAFGDFDEETARDILKQVSTLAENELGESLLESDRTPPTFDPETGEVTLPESFITSFLAWRDAEWWRLEVSEELGGTRGPASLTWAVSEMALGANPAVKMFSAGYTFAEVLRSLGNEAQQHLAQQMIDNHWGATMVLTEPDAGSDVGAGRAKAVQAEDGTWHISGVKRFITSGEAPFYDNVIHFVLARPEGAGPGTKGLSLFIVPKFHIGEDGELGERNGVQVANIEHKMGLKVSTTCELRFGEDPDNPAVGTLLGDSHDGIRQMFHIIEYARMLVGTKAIATLSTGYLNALEYAKERVQGADMTQMADKSAPRVTITHHPDVRRSLMLQKSYAEGLRALMLFTAAQQDTVMIAGDTPSEESQMAAKLNDLLLPLVKGCGSERAWVLLGTESLQTFGGSGFLQDYPIEQYIRDAKIDSLYEGTTAIQGQDFFFRKIVRDQGQALGHLAAQMMELVKGGGADDFLATERGLLGRALEDIQGMVEFMVGRVMASDPRNGGSPEAVYSVGLSTTRFLLAAGDVVIAWLLLRQAEVAQAALDAGAAGADRDFYLGKVAAARFFARDILPRVHSDRGIITHVDDSIMELPESAF
ncbi:acyl-CoA dehydrogenase [Ornithinimicrobium faecis]|uniref:Acyl-CoA dehydrogenase n=1 Tax=Ornithinimicrobium faecis TaxID=2934158 RepID=A0ABY4YUC4_9MICO|nr:acyl-CoA dehydrogenase [Ornithinimicrobium sp. HY1793]USQ80368.1 acyl-CoA dehydrogenase [Ornithinimicrobium sp. HY1793]